MNNKELIDSIDLSDSGPKGLVILTDNKTGNVIFKKHNLVVSEGRKYIFSLFTDVNKVVRVGEEDVGIFNNSQSSIANRLSDSFKGCRIGYLEFGIGTNDVSLTDKNITPVTVGSTAPLEHPLRFIVIPESATISGNKQVKATVVEDQDRYYLKFEFNFDGSILDEVSEGNKKLISELGVFLVPSSIMDIAHIEDDVHLFSRIRFDTLPITSDSSFMLQYYIYF